MMSTSEIIYSYTGTTCAVVLESSSFCVTHKQAAADQTRVLKTARERESAVLRYKDIIFKCLRENKLL